MKNSFERIVYIIAGCAKVIGWGIVAVGIAGCGSFIFTFFHQVAHWPGLPLILRNHLLGLVGFMAYAALIRLPFVWFDSRFQLKWPFAPWKKTSFFLSIVGWCGVMMCVMFFLWSLFDILLKRNDVLRFFLIIILTFVGITAYASLIQNWKKRFAGIKLGAQITAVVFCFLGAATGLMFACGSFKARYNAGSRAAMLSTGEHVLVIGQSAALCVGFLVLLWMVLTHHRRNRGGGA